MGRREPAIDRFRRKLVRAESGCLLWTGARGAHGYGNFWTGERYVLAHRYAYELEHGPLPSSERGQSVGIRGPVVMHSCDVPLCCEPTHLTLATQRDNMLDCQTKDRSPRLRRALMPEQVAELARRKRSGQSRRAIAQVMGISERLVKRESARLPRVARAADPC